MKCFEIDHSHPPSLLSFSLSPTFHTLSHLLSLLKPTIPNFTHITNLLRLLLVLVDAANDDEEGNDHHRHSPQIFGRQAATGGTSKIWKNDAFEGVQSHTYWPQWRRSTQASERGSLRTLVSRRASASKIKIKTTLTADFGVEACRRPRSSKNNNYERNTAAAECRRISRR